MHFYAYKTTIAIIHSVWVKQSYIAKKQDFKLRLRSRSRLHCIYCNYGQLQENAVDVAAIAVMFRFWRSWKPKRCRLHRCHGPLFKTLQRKIKKICYWNIVRPFRGFIPSKRSNLQRNHQYNNKNQGTTYPPKDATLP